jgi:hypothetical protein
LSDDKKGLKSDGVSRVSGGVDGDGDDGGGSGEDVSNVDDGEDLVDIVGLCGNAENPVDDLVALDRNHNLDLGSNGEADFGSGD